jgi:hypothetical protein
MAGKYNPFRPDKIAPPGMFCGRMDELRFLDHCLLQTKNGNPQHFLIEGERGIGKSSLFMSEYVVATGQVPTFDQDKRLDFLVVTVSLHPEDDYFSIVKRIIDGLRSQIAQRDKLKSFALSAWDIIKRVEGAGFRLRDAKDVDPTELLTTLQNDLVGIISSLGDSADGILFLIDEADKAPESANLGLLCKLLSEELSRKGCDKLCIGLAGLPGLISKLRASHESSPRIFKTMDLRPLEERECEQVIDIGMTEASDKNQTPIRITNDAKKHIAGLSEGYPHFLQEFAYCAFEADTDNVIDKGDVTGSLYSENGAFDQLGRKYFDQYYAAPDSDDYRTVLDAMAEHSDGWVQRATIIQETGLKGGTVDNAVRALKAKNIIWTNEQRSGQYRLPTKSFAIWIKARKEAARAGTSVAGLFEPSSKPKA